MLDMKLVAIIAVILLLTGVFASNPLAVRADDDDDDDFDDEDDDDFIPSIETRSIDGFGNNIDHPSWGSASILLLRLSEVAYDDGISIPAGQSRKSVREISNIVAAQDEFIPNHKKASDFIWQWGQFLDHDIDLTPGAHPAEPFDIPVPVGDP